VVGREWSKAMSAGLLGAALLAACVTDRSAGPAPGGGGGIAPPSSSASAPPALAEATPEAATEAAARYLRAGAYQRVVHLDGQRRRWTTIVPPSADGRPARGVVVVLHGVGGRGLDMRATAALEPLAAPEGVVLVFPDAFAGAWNDGRPGADPVVPGTAVDDVHFLRLLIDETVARTGATPDRVAVVGFSAGAMMASRLACDAADRVGAVALVGGTAGQGFQQSCRPARPVAAMVVAGSADPTVPYGGGRVADWGTRKRGFVASVDEVFAFWAAEGGCRPAAVPSGGLAGVVSELRSPDCRSGTAVVRYRVDGGGHEWFRLPRFDTTGTVWRFLSARFAAASGAALVDLTA